MLDIRHVTPGPLNNWRRFWARRPIFFQNFCFVRQWGGMLVGFSQAYFILRD